MRSSKPIPLLAAGLVLLFTLKLSAAADTWSHDDAAHLLRRAGFGGTPEQIDRLHAMGKTAAVEFLLSGTTAKPTTQPVFAQTDLPGFEFSKEPEDKKAAQMTKRQDLQRLRVCVRDRKFRTEKPLAEKMPRFWQGLFCSGFMEVKETDFMFQQNLLFRKE